MTEELDFADVLAGGVPDDTLLALLPPVLEPDLTEEPDFEDVLAEGAADEPLPFPLFTLEADLDDALDAADPAEPLEPLDDALLLVLFPVLERERMDDAFDGTEEVFGHTSRHG